MSATEIPAQVIEDLREEFRQLEAATARLRDERGELASIKENIQRLIPTPNPPALPADGEARLDKAVEAVRVAHNNNVDGCGSVERGTMLMRQWTAILGPYIAPPVPTPGQVPEGLGRDIYEFVRSTINTHPEVTIIEGLDAKISYVWPPTPSPAEPQPMSPGLKDLMTRIMAVVDEQKTYSDTWHEINVLIKQWLDAAPPLPDPSPAEPQLVGDVDAVAEKIFSIYDATDSRQIKFDAAHAVLLAHVRKPKPGHQWVEMPEDLGPMMDEKE